MKDKTPINSVVEAVRKWEDASSLVGTLNRTAEECRAIPFGIEREQCYIMHVFPLLEQVQSLGYSAEWNVEGQHYDPVVGEDKGGDGWAHPTIKLS